MTTKIHEIFYKSCLLVRTDCFFTLYNQSPWEKSSFFFSPSSSIRGFDQKVFVTQIQTALRNLRIKNPGTEYECFSKGKRKQLEFRNIKKKEIKSMVAFSEFDTLKYLWIEPLLSVRVCIVGADGEFWFHLLRFCCGVFLYLNLGTMRLREIGGERRRGIENPAELNIPVSRCNSQSSPWSGVENDSIGLCNSIKSPNKDFSVREFWTFSPTKTCSCWISLFISVFIRNRKKKIQFLFLLFYNLQKVFNFLKEKK